MSGSMTSDSQKLIPDINILSLTQYRVYDGLLASGFCFCLIVGLPGNILALIYFVKTKKRNLSTLLYIAACSIDIISCFFHFPLTVNLFNNRNAGLLGNRHFCSVWSIVLVVVQQTSMFVAMIISATRTLVIFFPFYRINKKCVFISIFLEFLFFFTMSIVINTQLKEFQYSPEIGYCDHLNDGSVFHSVMWAVYTIFQGFSPVIIFISLVASVIKLRNQSITDQSQRNNRKSSITIFYFSTIFLLCNSITFLNNVAVNYTMIILNKDYPGPLYSNNFMFFYSWPISELFCTVLNAALNPILYLCRMKNMRQWAISLVRNE